jgi:hypothetical protein
MAERINRREFLISALGSTVGASLNPFDIVAKLGTAPLTMLVFGDEEHVFYATPTSIAKEMEAVYGIARRYAAAPVRTGANPAGWYGTENVALTQVHAGALKDLVKQGWRMSAGEPDRPIRLSKNDIIILLGKPSPTTIDNLRHLHVSPTLDAAIRNTMRDWWDVEKHTWSYPSDHKSIRDEDFEYLEKTLPERSKEIQEVKKDWQRNLRQKAESERQRREREAERQAQDAQRLDKSRRSEFRQQQAYNRYYGDKMGVEPHAGMHQSYDLDADPDSFRNFLSSPDVKDIYVQRNVAKRGRPDYWEHTGFFRLSQRASDKF